MRTEVCRPELCMFFVLFAVMAVLLLCVRPVCAASAEIRQTAAAPDEITVSWEYSDEEAESVTDCEVACHEAGRTETIVSGLLGAAARSCTLKGLVPDKTYIVTLTCECIGSDTPRLMCETEAKTTPEQAETYSKCHFGYNQKGLFVRWNTASGGEAKGLYEYEIADADGKLLMTGQVTDRVRMERYPYAHRVTKIRVRPLAVNGTETFAGPWSAYKGLVPQPVLKTGRQYGFRKNKPILLGWNRVEGAKEYRVYIKKKGEPYKNAAVVKQKKSGVITVTLKKYRQKKNKKRTEYRIKIVTVAAGGLGKSSDSICYRLSSREKK